MKKWILAAMALLMTICLTAVQAEEPKMITYDFGDFTIELREGIFGSMHEKAEGASRLVVFPDYDENTVFHGSMDLSWNSAYADLKKAELEVFTDAALKEAREVMESGNLSVQSMALMESGHVKHDGMHGLVFMFSTDFSADVDGKAFAFSTVTKRYIFSDEYLGTYIITMNVEDLDEIEAMDAIVDTIRWN